MKNNSESLNLTKKTAHAVKWTYLSTIVRILLQIPITAALARLLEPASFRLIAMSSAIIHFAGFFSKMCISRAIVQKN